MDSLPLRGGEREAPLTRYGTVFPQMRITSHGRVFRHTPSGWEERTPTHYPYVRHGQGNGASGGNTQLTLRDAHGHAHRIRIHRAVMEAFKPLSQYSHEIGIPRAVWESLPPCVTQTLQHCVLVNHIDGEPAHNHVENLEWSTPMDNHRKARRGGFF